VCAQAGDLAGDCLELIGIDLVFKELGDDTGRLLRLIRREPSFSLQLLDQVIHVGSFHDTRAMMGGPTERHAPDASYRIVCKVAHDPALRINRWC
jgi:hypothetical protein